ncbi:MAG: hypothetical protein ABI963_02435 [Rhizomicrobium sp.]
MRTKFLFLTVLAGTLLAQSALAQDIPRIKARILSFDGKTLSVTSGTVGQNLSIGLIPTTRLMYEEKIDPASLKPGDYAGATLAKNGSKWQAKEVHLLPDALKGAGEGLFPLPSAPDQRVVTGTVGKNEAGFLTIGFRGSIGTDGATCSGRAPRSDGCKGEVSFALDLKAPAVAIKQGDKSILAVGKVAAISVIAGPGGTLMTPGLTVENETGGEVIDAAPAKSKPAK